MQLEALRNEKDEAMERLKAVKETAKRSLESSSKRHVSTSGNSLFLLRRIYAQSA